MKRVVTKRDASERIFRERNFEREPRKEASKRSPLTVASRYLIPFRFGWIKLFSSRGLLQTVGEFIGGERVRPESNQRCEEESIRSYRGSKTRKSQP